MVAPPVVAALLLLLFCSCSSSVHHMISDEHYLSKFLCEEWHNLPAPDKANVTLILNSSITHVLSGDRFCVLDSSAVHSPVKLTLLGQFPSTALTCWTGIGYNTSRFGLGFIGFSAVTIANVVIHNCGATLTPDAVNYINSSRLYFKSHSAVLLFSHCRSVNVSSTGILFYRGFAVMAVNVVENASFNELEAHSSQDELNDIGSGLLVYFTRSSTNHQQGGHPRVFIQNSSFTNNTSIYESHDCLNNLFAESDHKMEAQPVPSSAAITIIYYEQMMSSTVLITNSSIADNTGSFAAGLLVMYLNSHLPSLTAIKESTVFRNNTIKGHCLGTAIKFFTYFDFLRYKELSERASNSTATLLEAEGSEIRDHQNSDSGAVYLMSINPLLFKVIAVFRNFSFMDNKATLSGAALFAISYSYLSSERTGGLAVCLEDVTATNNLVKIGVNGWRGAKGNFIVLSIFAFHHVKQVTITGNHSLFQSNYGSVVQADCSPIVLNGSVKFLNNHGVFGGALHITTLSTLLLTEGLNAQFINNSAKFLGGAIYGDSHSHYCVFQVNGSISNMFLMFQGNSAMNGKSIYASQLYDCYNGRHTSNTELKQQYNAIFRNTSAGDISTLATKLYCCDNDTHINRTLRSLPSKVLYPGQTFSVYLAAFDAINNSVTTDVLVTTLGSNYSSNDVRQFYDNQNSDIASIREYDNLTDTICTELKVNFTTECLNGCERALLYSLPSFREGLKQIITMKSCPLGFVMGKVKNKLKCICEHALSGKLVHCNIQSQTIVHNTRSLWMGSVLSDKRTHQFAYSTFCPLLYCNELTRRGYIQVHGNDSDFLCTDNRTGVMCGNCEEGFSVVFGSSKCMKCSNWWLFTLLIYLVIPVFLILVMFCLKLTLATGTVNGIIFYASTSSAGIDQIFYYGSSFENYSYVAKLFLYLFRLTVNFPTCFYDGMTEISKQYLFYVYPVYILSLIGLLVLFSNFSVRVSNRLSRSTIQVLVTIIHLCFSRLLLVLIFVYTPVSVHTEHEVYHVWYLNGNIRYFEGEHKTLVIFSVIVVIVFILPYITILLLGKQLKRIPFLTHKLGALLDAIHAPYKDKYKHWFLARLLLQILIYFTNIAFLVKYTGEMVGVTGALLLAFTIVQAFMKPFKNNYINVLDFWIMINFTGLYGVTIFLYNSSTDHGSAVLACDILITLFFITAIIVILLHLLWVTGLLHKLQDKLLLCKDVYHRHFRNRAIYRPCHIQQEYSSCSQLREPVLSFSQ